MKEINQETISISVPQTINEEKIWQKILQLFETAFDAVRTRKNRFNFQSPQLINKFSFKNINKKTIVQYLTLALILVMVLVGGIKLIDSISQSSSSGVSLDNTKIADAVKTERINKDFKFSLRDEKGKEISTFTYSIESADLRKEILVKGQKATAVKGRIFLILNLKLVNTLKQGINVNAKDYVRLTVNDKKDELLAPDIHNDPVEVQAISTKFTRVGFAINEADKNQVLHIGEIDGKKEEIRLNFK